MGSKASGSGIPFISQIEGEYELNMDTAKAIQDDARYNADQRRRQADLMMGEQIAAYGVSGVELEGSPTLQIQEDRKIAEIEAMNIIFSGKVNANRAQRQASLSRQNAYLSLAKDAGMFAVSAGAFKGGGSTPPKGAINLSPDKAGGTTEYSRAYLGDK